jgi:hypothetical protein
MTIRPKPPKQTAPIGSNRPVWPSASSSNARGSRSVPPSRNASPSAGPTSEAVNRIAVYTKRSPLHGARSTESATKAAKILLQIRIETSPQLLPQIGDFVRAYTRARFQPRSAEKISLASYELIENAVSYGSVSGDVIFCLSETHRGTEICVTNNSSPGRIANLRSQLDRIRLNPEKAYQDEMSRSVTGAGGRATLGLARICHEGQLDLEFESEGMRVTMCAICGR